VKKTKTGYSTNYDVLNKLKEVHPIAQKILDYREAHKIYSTYVKPYMNYLDEEQRLYTYFDYCGTSTGRLSSKDPNLQNIPVKGEWGNKMRKLFIPREGYKIMSADYSQMELRLLAQFSEDETLNEIFEDDRDIHTETAIHLFGMSDKRTRNFAKSINYGIVYGLSPYGLSQQLEIELSEAKDYIERYFDRFQGVERYINEQISKARKNGYVSVISKRRRYVRGINSSNRFRREAAERIAVNTPLQGSSAEILKVVMNNIHKEIKNNDKIYLVSQIHDELLFEVKEGEENRFKKIIKDIMEDIPFLIKVKMKVDISTGNNWWEAH
ncbi:MAG: DNA polymerase I, partial [Candidatus Mcinerneyibacterium aminivorans]